MIKHIVFDHDGTLVEMGTYRNLFKGIPELLTELSQRNIKLYIWTARNRASCLEILKSLDIIGFFEDISTSSDCEVKPNPEGLLNMLGDVNPKEVIIIGDSSSDIYGAKNFGAISIGALWDNPGELSRKHLMQAGADYTSNSPQECRNLLIELINKE